MMLVFAWIGMWDEDWLPGRRMSECVRVCVAAWV